MIICSLLPRRMAGAPSRLQTCRLLSSKAGAKLPVIGVVDLEFRGGRFDEPQSEEDAIERRVAAGRAQVVYTGARTVEDVRRTDLGAFDALMFRRCYVGEAALELMPRLRCLIRMGAGYDNVDVAACNSRGVVACNIPDSWVEEVADTTVGHILALLRQSHILANHVASGKGWTAQARLPQAGIRRIRGMRLGIVGLGRIGTAVALRASAFGFHTSFFDPYVRFGMEKGLNLTRHESLQLLLENSDVVTLHTPLNGETYHMLRADTFPAHPIYVVNCARGGLVHEGDLISALQTGQVLGAGLDCLEKEPTVSGSVFTANNDLAKMLRDGRHNLIVTPHSSFYSNEAYAEMRTTATLEALRVLQGQMPRFQLMP